VKVRAKVAKVAAMPSGSSEKANHPAQRVVARNKLSSLDTIDMTAIRSPG
jgi:hypothetical protein